MSDNKRKERIGDVQPSNEAKKVLQQLMAERGDGGEDQATKELDLIVKELQEVRKQLQNKDLPGAFFRIEGINAFIADDASWTGSGEARASSVARLLGNALVTVLNELQSQDKLTDDTFPNINSALDTAKAVLQSLQESLSDVPAYSTAIDGAVSKDDNVNAAEYDFETEFAEYENKYGGAEGEGEGQGEEENGGVEEHDDQPAEEVAQDEEEEYEEEDDEDEVDAGAIDQPDDSDYDPNEDSDEY